jgi:chromate transporter
MTPVGEIIWLFLRLGATSFGGPAVHIAMMEEEVVRRREWLTREQFLDLLGATNLIPGPNSTELAIHIGRARAGWPGLVAAGVSFIVPAMLIVTAAAWGYVHYGALPKASGVLYGVKPVVIVIVAQALWRLGRSAVTTPTLALVGGLAVAASATGVHELLVLAACGVATALIRSTSHFNRGSLGAVLAAGTLAAGASSSAAVSGAAATAAVPFSRWLLFWVFAKTGAVLFGSGYVLLAFLRADLVERLGWLSSQQLLDATAVGQVTPGPVFTTATFIGYVLGGASGALVATVGIFLPAFFFVGVSGAMVPRLRQSAIAGALLDGVNVGSLALMTMVSWQLGRTAIVDRLTVALALASGLALFRYRVSSGWLILAGAFAGTLARVLGR